MPLIPTTVSEVLTTGIAGAKEGLNIAEAGGQELGKALGVESAGVIFIADCDVYKNYRWSVNSPRQAFIEDVPTIILTEFQPNSSPVMEDIRYTLTSAESIVKAGANVGNPKVARPDPYMKIYSGVFTGNVYQFPFFSEYNHSMASTWGKANDITDIGSKFRKGISLVASTIQYGSVEERKVWKGSGSAQYQFSFNLYNTVNPEVDIIKNITFIRGLINNALPARTSFATLLPPCFYKLEIPGVRYAPVVSLDNITIDNIGQVNRRNITLPIGGGESSNVDMNIPDAYRITIAVNELHNESRDIYAGVFDNTSKVKIVDEIKLGDKRAQNVNQIRDLTGGKVNRR